MDSLPSRYFLKNNSFHLSKPKSYKNTDKCHNLSLCQEFLSICKNLSDEQVQVAFAKFDTSGDDKLDYREFCQMINKRNED